MNNLTIKHGADDMDYAAKPPSSLASITEFVFPLSCALRAKQKIYADDGENRADFTRKSFDYDAVSTGKLEMNYRHEQSGKMYRVTIEPVKG